MSFPESGKRHLAHFRVWQAGETSSLSYCSGQDTQVIALLTCLDLWGVEKGSTQLFNISGEAERQGTDW